MKTSLKIGLISSIIFISGLTGSLCYAEPKLTISDNYSTLLDAKLLTPTHSTSSSTLLANIKLDNLSTKQPLPGIQVVDFALLSSENDSKNAFFEFAVKFNDKLQQVLAFFNFSSAPTAKINSEKETKQVQKEAIKLSKKNVASNHSQTCNRV